MGTTISRSTDLSDNEYCAKFVNKDPLSINDPFWNRFLSFNMNYPITRDDQIVLDSKIEPLCQQLLLHNQISKNFGSLLQIFIDRSAELLGATTSDAVLFNWQLYNSLFVIRCILKFLTEISTEEQLLEHTNFNATGALLETFIGSLFSIVVDLPVQDNTFLIHLEAVTCLLILLSVQFHSGQHSDNSIVFNIIMKGQHIRYAPVFVKSLLNNFISQKPLVTSFGNDEPGHSIVVGIASELWSLLTFSKKSDHKEFTENSEFQQTPLATQSILLMLVLVHNWTTLNNPYRSSLFSCLNQDNNPPFPNQEHAIFKIDFDALYLVFCKKDNIDMPLLLLYLLLHRNPTFKTYLLQRLDLQDLIVPILKTLYNAPNSHSHHIYMSIIILLILSEDDTFNKVIHVTKLKNITWYSERQLTEISLGGLLILVIIRTIQYNMLKMRDKYLHTNCLAALANMSSQFRDLHPYVSQRLVSLFGTLAKKYNKICTELKSGHDPSSETRITVDRESELEQDLNVLEEVLRMILEIINSVLTSQLTHNPNLIYTLLYNRHVFEAFKDTVVFQDIIHNIEIVVKYFSDVLTSKNQLQELDAYQVLQVIQQGGKYWPKDKLTRLPDLKFKYVEEEQPEEFFIPYVWDLVNQHSVLNWNMNSALKVVVC
ncbi:hypothetical protein ABEB36_008463 [Hypothenemus hampei]|uniref:Dymeclin n=1 Tax=Hypothenemus hampei TaxID=57062 RepID=A0ABD1EP66_HYPHA